MIEVPATERDTRVSSPLSHYQLGPWLPLNPSSSRPCGQQSPGCDRQLITLYPPPPTPNQKKKKTFRFTHMKGTHTLRGRAQQPQQFQGPLPACGGMEGYSCSGKEHTTVVDKSRHVGCLKFVFIVLQFSYKAIVEIITRLITNSKQCVDCMPKSLNTCL